MGKKEEKIIELFPVFNSFMHKLFNEFQPSLKLKLNMSEERTLISLYNQEGQPMKEYSMKVGLNKSSFTVVADKLANKGLVEREPVQNDRRKLNLVLTDEGRKVAQKVKDELDNHISNKMKELNYKDKQELINALETLTAITKKIR